MSERSSQIRGIRYEVSEPIRNRKDGYYYQRVRQVDGNGNLVGIGEQIHRSTKPYSEDGLFASPLDLGKLAMLAGDLGQTLYGGIARDLRTMAIGATRFARDAASGLTDGYKSWPDTDRPWEPILDWRSGNSGVEYVQDGGVDGIGDGRGIGNWRENSQSISRGEPRSDRWASIPVPDFSPPPLPRAPEWNNVFVRDSASGAGVPSRNNVFEYGFPEPGPVSTPISEAPPVRKLSSWRVRSDGLVGSESLGSEMPRPGANGPPPSRVFDTSASPIPYLPGASQQAPRGLPALLAEISAFDSFDPKAPPSGGLPGLIQEYLRNR